MTLVSIGQELKRAQAGSYGLPLFDAFDVTSADGIFQALEDCRAPAMVAVYSPFLDYANARAFTGYLRARAEDAPGPVSLMLDHGANFVMCMKALKLGFSDVMYDGSQLPIAENIANTKAVVQVAHAFGACVEAELGHVGAGGEYQGFGAQRQGFTNPDDVERFVAETGVDFLAVAIGTAHGEYQSEPHLDLDLLAEIRQRVDIPLVMHGGSGLSAAQFQAAIASGISKINVATDLFNTAGRRVVEAAHGEKPSYLGMEQVALEAFRERCGYYLDIFGAVGKADRS